MGLQIRKRTKGKSGWLNFSYSERNGFGTSVSVKPLKGITHNFGGKRGSRTTIDLGNGIRYVSYGEKPKSKPKAKTSSGSGYVPSSSPQPDWDIVVPSIVAIIAEIWLVNWIGFLFGTAVVVAGLVLWYKVLEERICQFMIFVTKTREKSSKE